MPSIQWFASHFLKERWYLSILKIINGWQLYKKNSSKCILLYALSSQLIKRNRMRKISYLEKSVGRNICQSGSFRSHGTFLWDLSQGKVTVVKLRLGKILSWSVTTWAPSMVLALLVEISKINGEEEDVKAIMWYFVVYSNVHIFIQVIRLMVHCVQPLS